MVADLRLFVAADLTPEARHLLAQVLAARAPRGLPGRVVPPENWHLTLRFLGETDETTLDRVVAGLDEAELGAGFRVEFDSLGAFPKAGRATVLWVGVGSGAERLSEIAELVEGVAVAAGYPPEDRPFAPHLTLSRIRPPQDLRPMLERDFDGRISFELDALTLFRSHLGRGPARYEAIEVFPLR